MAPTIKRIPFAKHMIPSEAVQEAAKVIESGWLRQGKYAEKVESELKKITGAKHAVVTSSCTAALHLCFLMQEKKGQIAVPALTYPATQNAICHGRHKPRFIEVDENRYTLCPTELKQTIKKQKMVGIAPVHALGIPCKIDEIMEVAEAKNMFVIEDCAQALGSTYKNKSVGTFGHAGCFSFDPIKPVTSGEGGAIISNDKELVENARMLKDNGRDNTKMHKLIGFNYKPTDFQMALVYTLMKELDKITASRREMYGWYNELLNVDGIQTHPEFNDSKQNCIYYTLKLEKNATKVYEAMKEKGIETKNYPPVNLEPAFKFLEQRVPKTEQLCQHLLSLPVYPGLTYADAEYVANCLKETIK